VAGFVTGVAIGTTREVVKVWACPNEASDFQGFALTVALATGAGIATSKAGRLSPAAIAGLMGLGGYGVYESGKGFVSNLGKAGENPLCYGTLAALDAVDTVLGTYDLLQGVRALRNGIDSLRNPKPGDSNSPNSPNDPDSPNNPNNPNNDLDNPSDSDGVNNPNDPSDPDGNGNNNNNDDPDGNGNNNDDDGNGNNNNDEDDGFNPTQCFRSFSADTTVVTPYGNTRISDLLVGDTVLAFDEETGDFVEQEVTATWYHLDDVVELVIDGELVRTTADHPFYTAYETWVEAGDLEEGDHILSADGGYGRVTSVRSTSDREMMYNLTVSEDHTYVVGSGQWVVHNVCDIERLKDAAKLGSVAEELIYKVSRQLGGYPEATIGTAYKSDGTIVVSVGAEDQSTIKDVSRAVVNITTNDGRGRSFEVIDPSSIVINKSNGSHHAEQLLYNRGYTEIGISNPGGLCGGHCTAFFQSLDVAIGYPITRNGDGSGNVYNVSYQGVSEQIDKLFGR